VGRQPLRDQCLLRLIYRHGLRASEARDAKWTDLDIMVGSGPKTFHVRRLKGSVDSVHTLNRDEVSALRRLRADSTSPFVFVSEQGGPLSPDMIARIVERAGEAAKLGFHVHPHMLRHATGYALANEGTDTRLIQDFLAAAAPRRDSGRHRPTGSEAKLPGKARAQLSCGRRGESGVQHLFQQTHFSGVTLTSFSVIE
jgi:integrase